MWSYIRETLQEGSGKSDDLSSQEERILAYTHYAAGEQAVRMNVE